MNISFDPVDRENERQRSERGACLEYLEENSEVASAIADFVGGSAFFLGVINRLAAFAPSPFPIFIYGETGTGKESVSRAIHSLSERSGEYVPFNCAAFGTSDLQLTELFGCKKGAYTDATEDRFGLCHEANRGTLFLDEIGWMKPETQAGLNHLLDARSTRGCRFRRLGSLKEEVVDVRIVSAHNQAIDRDMHALYDVRSSFLRDLKPEFEARKASSLEAGQRLLESTAARKPEYEKHADYGREWVESVLSALHERVEANLASLQVMSESREWSDEVGKALIKELEKDHDYDPPVNADLAYRLNRLTIYIPPLRDRPGDALLVAVHHADGLGVEISPEILCNDVLPLCLSGNARSIINRLTEIALVPDARYISKTLMAKDAKATFPELNREQAEVRVRSAREYLAEFNRLCKKGRPPKRGPKPLVDADEILKQLLLCEGNQSETAKALGMKRPTLRDRLSNLSIDGIELSNLLPKHMTGKSEL